MLDREPGMLAQRPGLLLIADKGFAAKRFEQDLADGGVTLLRPNHKNEKQRPGQGLLKAVRQLIESVNDTLKGLLDLELHGARTFQGIAPRVAALCPLEVEILPRFRLEYKSPLCSRRAWRGWGTCR
jgi:hypothetical protein